MVELKGWKEVPMGGVCWVKSDEYLTGDWRTFKPVLSEEKCTKCGFCWIYCPDNSIIWDGESYPKIDYDHCKGCGICAEQCPVGAIKMELE